MLDWLAAEIDTTSEHSNVLNPTLYQLLRRRFNIVKVSNAGVRADATPVGDAKMRHTGGEYYKVCCPKCGDGRYRLWVSYLWGTKDQTGRSMEHLYHCFNEHCEKRGFSLADELSRVMYSRALSMPINSRVAVSHQEVLQTPGKCVPLASLPTSHPACRFFMRRNFDPFMVSKKHGVCVCVEPHKWLGRYKQSLLKDRIVFPIGFNNKQIAWQARYVGQDGDGVAPDDVPKYLTADGFKKSQYLYNYDYAASSDFPFGIVVEGVMDVLRVRQSVACFGHILSVAQKDLLFGLYRNSALVLLFDRDAAEDSQRQRDALYSSYRGGVASVILPDDRDPGDWDAEELWTYMCREAGRQDVHLIKP